MHLSLSCFQLVGGFNVLGVSLFLPQLSYSEIALAEACAEDFPVSHSLSYPVHWKVEVVPGRHHVATAVNFMLSMIEPDSGYSKETSFIPFAPLKCECTPSLWFQLMHTNTN